MSDVHFGELNDAEPAFGQWVRERRQKLAISQSELVQRLADRGMLIDASAISRIESGTRSVRLSEALGIADALEAPLGAEFFTYKSPNSTALVEALSSVERALFRREEAIGAQMEVQRAVAKQQESAEQHRMALIRAQDAVASALPLLSPDEVELLRDRLRSLKDIPEWQAAIALVEDWNDGEHPSAS